VRFISVLEEDMNSKTIYKPFIAGFVNGSPGIFAGGGWRVSLITKPPGNGSSQFKKG
jgi:hypothetical protein